jgi:hypothetical protein
MLDFENLTKYALRNKRGSLLHGILHGTVIPAFEQPCWDCGRLRYFWDDYNLGVVEQCCSK